MLTGVQHPQQFSHYGYNDSIATGGPGGEWGLIKSHAVDCSVATDSGVIVQSTVNQRAEHPYLYVKRKLTRRSRSLRTRSNAEIGLGG